MDWGNFVAAMAAMVLLIFGTNFQHISRLREFSEVARILHALAGACIGWACLILVWA